MPKKKRLESRKDLTKQASSKEQGRRSIFGRTKTPAPKMRYSNRLSYNDLVELESEWGGTMFGPIPYGHQRKFFEHEKNVWIWHENWFDNAGNLQEITIRYEVRPAGVFKRTSGQKYEKLSSEELNNFRIAARNYLQLIKTKLYY